MGEKLVPFSEERIMLTPSVIAHNVEFGTVIKKRLYNNCFQRIGLMGRLV